MGKQTPSSTASILSAIRKRMPGIGALIQRQRLLLALEARDGVTTIDALRFLDIIDPAARVFELRREGHCIVTNFVLQATECGDVHCVGCYTLQTLSTLGARSTVGTQLELPLAPHA
ncbi:helix-turn-helix domain-containing protein [Paraburkholderia mimosarum]|uniref:helix-turn-helix domain-containing protein n=1 Tax=Paraburkholderia mimosarum TaxID=312026 RepID=UPI0003FEBBB9|nr:helix-turn-helix domain-containing protein [Paraburkholderia mimosarum]